MKRSLVVLIVVGLILSSSPFVRAIEISNEDWMSLRAELWNSKQLSITLRAQIVDLGRSLQQAKESQVISAEKIASLEIGLARASESLSISEKKIDDLEKRLAQANLSRGELQEQVASLRTQLTELGALLNDTRSQLEANEAKHIAEIEDLVKGYETQITVGRTIRNVLIAVVVAETVYIIVSALNK